jgi:hypothetical protein
MLRSPSLSLFRLVIAIEKSRSSGWAASAAYIT